MESEKHTERYLVKQVRALGGLCIKWVSESNRGVPDRICLLPNGIIRFVEVKSEGEEPSPLQQHVIKNLRNLGFIVEVLDTKAKVDFFLCSIYKMEVLHDLSRVLQYP